MSQIGVSGILVLEKFELARFCKKNTFDTTHDDAIYANTACFVLNEKKNEEYLSLYCLNCFNELCSKREKLKNIIKEIDYKYDKGAFVTITVEELKALPCDLEFEIVHSPEGVGDEAKGHVGIKFLDYKSIEHLHSVAKKFALEIYNYLKLKKDRVFLAKDLQKEIEEESNS